MEEVTQLYKSGSVAGVPTTGPTLSELTKLKFGLIQIKERNRDYTHFKVTSVRHISSTLHQIANSIRTKITSALKIQIFQYFMRVQDYVRFPHYGGNDVSFCLKRSQSYDCIKNCKEIRNCSITVEGVCKNSET